MSELQIVFYGNFDTLHTSETHHVQSLRALGHEVTPFQEPHASAEALYYYAAQADLFVWVHTHGWHTPGMEKTLGRLRAKGVPTVTYHLDLWHGLKRQEDMMSDNYWGIEHFFTVDKKMADWLNQNTEVNGHYLPAGVFDQDCYRAPTLNPSGIVFVGSYGYHPEWPYRPKLIDWLKNQYGDLFQHYGNGGLPSVRGHELNQVYADAKIVVGDSLCLGFEYPWYWSDRIYETLGRGGFLIHPAVPGIGSEFNDGKHAVFYQYDDFSELKSTINYYLHHDYERELIRSQGHQHVKNNFTYKHRWEHILKEIGL